MRLKLSSMLVILGALLMVAGPSMAMNRGKDKAKAGYVRPGTELRVEAASEATGSGVSAKKPPVVKDGDEGKVAALVDLAPADVGGGAIRGSGTTAPIAVKKDNIFTRHPTVTKGAGIAVVLSAIGYALLGPSSKEEPKDVAAETEDDNVDTKIHRRLNARSGNLFDASKKIKDQAALPSGN